MSIQGKPPLRAPIQKGDRVTRPWSTWFESIAITMWDDTFLVSHAYGDTNEIDITDNGDGTINIGIEDTYVKNRVLGTTDKVTVTDNGDGTVTLTIPDTYLPLNVLGTTGRITVTDNADGTITLTIPDDYIEGTANEITVADDGDGTFTLSLPDPVIVADIETTKNVTLSETTYANQYGIVYKDIAPFIHDFNYGDNGTVVTTGENIFVGANAGNFSIGSTATLTTHGSYNACVGDHAGYSLTTGYRNLFFGSSAGRSCTSGNSNAFFGTDAGRATTTGYGNLFIGYGAGYWNSTGFFNVYLGTNAGYYGTTGYSNVAIGRSAGINNVTGANNCTIGHYAGYSNITNDVTYLGTYAGYGATTATKNCFVGRSAGYYTTTGGYNTYLGAYAGMYAGTGVTQNNTSVYCVLLGAYTRVSADGVTYENVIGYGAVGKGSNTTTIGASTQTDTFCYGNVKAISGGVTPNEGGAGTRPAASSAVRGMIWVTQNGSGVADTVDICLKSSADTYSWVNIATG